VAAIAKRSSTGLSPVEQVDLKRFEVVIERGIRTFHEVGEALAAVRDRKLYRATHRSFQEYCEQRWNMSRPHAYRLIEAAAIVHEMSPRGDKASTSLSTPSTSLPTTEKQVRQLARVPPEARAEVFEAAVDAAGGEQPTAQQVAEAAHSHIEMSLADPLPPASVADPVARFMEGVPPIVVAEPSAEVVYPVPDERIVEPGPLAGFDEERDLIDEVLAAAGREARLMGENMILERDLANAISIGEAAACERDAARAQVASLTAEVERQRALMHPAREGAILQSNGTQVYYRLQGPCLKFAEVKRTGAAFAPTGRYGYCSLDGFAGRFTVVKEGRGAEA
jgi:hypothetical protein